MALADSADVSAEEQGSSFAPEPDPLRLGARAGGAGRTKRLQGSKPTSLDLTFHMLRELLQTSRAESLSHRARFNQHLLKTLGKRAELV
ncbi:corticoliberin-like [Astyanax mexicanus]|nr:corticoliberin-like [Astyanax mexicanus]